jgi:hypothetical protein
MSTEGRPTGRPDIGTRVGSVAIYIPLVGFVVNLSIVLIAGVDDWKVAALEIALTWLVGVNGIITGTGHMFMPAPVARGIGWPTSPFQWEVGLADLSYGVLGVMAPSFDRGFWLATIVAFSVFMLGAATGHARSMVRDHDFAPGNAGYIFWYDIIAPLALIALYVVTR